MNQHEPNWQKILASEIWREEIAPMLDAMIERTQDSLAVADLPKVRALQGQLMALKAFRYTPQAEHDFNKAMRRELAKQGLIDPETDEPVTEENQDEPERGRIPTWARRWWRRGAR